TAMAQKADIERSIELGADGYIEKPFDPINLPKQVEDIYKRCKKGE
ncbi:MAG TPA: response regulator, partial [candidate division Zixibacteria bacterium]|nr:response regulator [candidate division Zixibacteria bacterium]